MSSAVDPVIAAGEMAAAVVLGEAARQVSPPNPWVGAVVLSRDGRRRYEGATEAPGGRHAEIVALDHAGDDAIGGTLVVTLEPCSHQGRTGPCADAIIEAGITTVIVALEDPDPLVAGAGRRRLEEAGVKVHAGVGAELAEASLAAYLHQRRTGRPLVILKLAGTLDGRTAAPDGSSRWITGPEARADVHALRARSDAIIVGAGTVRADNPALTARTTPSALRQPLRVVLGRAPEDAQVHPCWERSGDLGELLDELGAAGILQVLVEGGATVAHDFVSADLVDRFVLYLAPAIMGGDDGSPLLRGSGAPSMEQVRRGRFISVTQLGEDLRLEVAA
jgi:diaminohydroxyphosphoribosylaminopyrimidine deaminase/5-amino-6-(5-phosphoribosylamino)uracil reductase